VSPGKRESKGFNPSAEERKHRKEKIGEKRKGRGAGSVASREKKKGGNVGGERKRGVRGRQ
jgi:hypothetical protein